MANGREWTRRNRESAIFERRWRMSEGQMEPKMEGETMTPQMGDTMEPKMEGD